MNSELAFKMIFGIVGGLGIFLLGMKNMSEGMQAVAGDRMRKLINAVTNNRIIACGIGVVVTCLIQSSSVTTVMVVGMVNAGLMNLMQAIGVVLGADIGTTITGWILVLEIAKYGLPIIGISAFFFLFSKNERVRFTALMIVGLGMVFFGLSQMKQGFSPLREMPEFIAWFSKFTPDSYFGVLKCCLVGAFVTAIVQSSSATLGITIGLVGTGLINFETGAALVLGENIGTTITACLAALGASTNARRTALAHVLIKVIGVGWITIIFFHYTSFIKYIIGTDPTTSVMNNGLETFPYAMRAIALSHTCFNVANVILLMPFMSLLVKLLNRVMPDKAYKEVPHLKYIDVRLLEAPAISIEQSEKEVVQMSEIVRKMFFRLRQVIFKDEKNEIAETKIFHREEILDIIQKEITEFLSRLLAGSVSQRRIRIDKRLHYEYSEAVFENTQVVTSYFRGSAGRDIRDPRQGN
ncbi:MAG: Na/Pi cotransporter family protein [Planctomycetota bacterium]|jgi:phosphate:Na+ symporter